MQRYKINMKMVKKAKHIHIASMKFDGNANEALRYMRGQIVTENMIYIMHNTMISNIRFAKHQRSHCFSLCS